MAKPAAEGILGKLKKIKEIVAFHGGIKGSLRSIYLTDELKKGELVGEDYFGNKYYRNDEYIMGRNKWVVFNPKYGQNYDGSMIPPEWHRWIQNMTDTPPTVKPLDNHRWMIKHQPNKTGTNQRYVPYSTTRPKVESWKPPQ